MIKNRSSLRLKWRVLGCDLGFPVVSLMCFYTVVVPPVKNEDGEDTHYEKDSSVKRWLQVFLISESKNKSKGESKT